MRAAQLAALATASVIVVIIILIVATPCAILVRMMNNAHRRANCRSPRALVSEVYPLIKTGDIMLFASLNTPSYSGVVRTFYSHSAMLIREGELVYTSEAQRGSSIMPAAGGGPDFHMAVGTSTAPFLVRAKAYFGAVFVMRLSRPLDPAREARVKAAAARLCGYAYPTLAQSCVAVVTGGRTVAGARHCFQHVAHLLDEASLAPLSSAGPFTEAGFFQVCREVCDLARRPLPDGYYYEPPVELLYDIDCLRATSMEEAGALAGPDGLEGALAEPDVLEGALAEPDESKAEFDQAQLN